MPDTARRAAPATRRREAIGDCPRMGTVPMRSTRVRPRRWLRDQADARALAGCGGGGDDIGRALVEARLERLAHLLAAHVGGVHPPAGELGVETADTLGRVVKARAHLILAHSPRCRPHCGRKSIENGGRSKAPTVKKRT